MRVATLRIVANKHPTAKFRIEGYREEGKRKRLFFRTFSDAEKVLKEKAKAQAFIQQQEMVKWQREGESAARLPDQVRLMSIRAIEVLTPFGKTIDDAVRHYVAHLEQSSKSIKVNALIEKYLSPRNPKSKKWSKRHREDVKARLDSENTRSKNAFSGFKDGHGKLYGELLASDVTPDHIKSWLADFSDRGLSDQTINNYWRRAFGLFAFAVKEKHCATNPVAEVERPEIDEGEIEVFAPDELSKLLKVAPNDILPYIALGAFAGIRGSELLRLEWSDINLSRKYIEIKAKKSKTASRRLIDIQDNLLAWLMTYEGQTGLIWKESIRMLYTKLGKLAESQGIEWVDNGLRHSFASYHLAKFGDANRLALQLGHTTTAMLFKHYREVVTPDQAEEYWKIKP
jgi:integrase